MSALKELINDLYGAWRLSGYPVIVFGTTSESTRVPATVLSCFKHEVTFEVDICTCLTRLNPKI